MTPFVVSMGDPAGIGPEIIGGLLKSRPSDDILVVGDARMLDAPVIRDFSEYQGGHAILNLPSPKEPHAGDPDPSHAPAIRLWIETAVQLVTARLARALITAPISKEILINGADFPFPGHTEFLAHLDGAKHPVMMLVAPQVRVIPLTIHIPLRKVHLEISPELLKQTVDITHKSLVKMGVSKPRIAVAGLNPHAGENGKIGHEEGEWINATITDLSHNYHITGPLPADTMFHAAARKHYDVAICMYHDQALIPIKTLAFDEGVNVTLGLSFLRTSPDHGTAFDIAGKGIANPASMIAAFDFAKEYS